MIDGDFNDAKTFSLVPFVAGSSLFRPGRICRPQSAAKDFDGQREALV
jgi:hypothetical protein